MGANDVGNGNFLSMTSSSKLQPCPMHPCHQDIYSARACRCSRAHVEGRLVLAYFQDAAVKNAYGE